MWALMSRKLKSKIETPRSVGFFTQKEAKAKEMRLVIGHAGSLEQGEKLSMYVLVDESDGVIADVKFQAFGDALLVGAAEVTCNLLLRKNYDQARRLSAELIEKQVEEGNLGFPKEAASSLNLVIEAIEEAAMQCMDIPLSDHYIVTPVQSEDLKQTATAYPKWDELAASQKLQVIQEIVQKEIQPYVELDAGGVEVMDVRHREVIIGYKGSCTSCYSATGSTLQAIQELLRHRVHPDLIVIPDLSAFKS